VPPARVVSDSVPRHGTTDFLLERMSCAPVLASVVQRPVTMA
jgi:hypothetical protein